MEKKEINYIFDEKQYLAHNKLSLFRRIAIAIFCFVAYFLSGNPSFENTLVSPITAIDQSTANLLFMMGIVVLVMSAILTFVVHLHTTLMDGSLIIDGTWTSRKVKIDIASIVSARKVAYSKYQLNRPVYNLHIKGKIRFYTHGKDAVELTDKDGLIYIVGSQRANELTFIVNHYISKK